MRNYPGERLLENARRLVEPVIWDERYPGIFIAYDNYRGDAWVPDDFVATTRASLLTITTKPIGKKLLEDISAKCQSDASKKVVIEYKAGGAIAAPVDDTTNEFRKKIQTPVDMGGEAGFVKSVMKNTNIVGTFTGNILDGTIKEIVGGTGSSAIVCFNHKDVNDSRPIFIALAHELVHAFHYNYGNCYRGIGDDISADKDAGIMEEEMRTVGFGKYNKEVPSENAIRGEHEVGPRLSYIPKQDWAHVTASVFV